MIDLVKEFPKYHKDISKYILSRLDMTDKSECKKLLKKRIERLNSSWDMQVAGSTGGRTSGQNYLAQMSYGLVKQQQLTLRAIFSNNFRPDPIFSLRAIGNTPQENAINMQDIMQANNEQTQFRQLVLQPVIDHVCRWGIAVTYTEYCNNQKRGWRTVADPMYIAARKYGIIKNTHNAVTTVINPLNYGQNPNIVSCEDSDYRYCRERWKLSKLIDRIKSYPDLYIKENVEKVIKEVKASNGLDKEYYDPQGRQTIKDYDGVAINDIVRGQFQIGLEGNEDDSQYYYVEMVGPHIIRFQDNPYDMNLNQFQVLTAEPRMEYFWGNTAAEYSIGNENMLNLLLGISMENALESMKKYIFYNKNAIDPNMWAHAASNGKIPVDVNKDVSLNNLLWTYQPQDTSGSQVGDAYARILENDQRFSTTPDLNRPTSQGGPANKTATAANIMSNKGDTKDADQLERFSFCLAGIGEQQNIILAQFLGNFGPILIRPSAKQSIREVMKQHITGNMQVVMDTALQQSYQGELTRIQNVTAWLLNIINGSGGKITANIEPMIRQVLKMGKIMNIDEIMPENESNQAQLGYQPTAPQPGQEMAGAAQEVMG